MRALRLVVLSAAAVVAMSALSPALATSGGPVNTSRQDTGTTPTPLTIAPGSATDTRALQRHALEVASGQVAGTPATVHLVARVAPGTAVTSVRSALRTAGLAPSSSLSRLGFLTVTVPASSAASARARLAATPGVTAVTESAPRDPLAVPADPRYAGEQAVMYSALRAPAAWDSATGSGATIAMLDSGFDVGHEDLAGKISLAWDVVAGSADVSDSPSLAVPGHGTATASVAAAATNNGLGIAGAAPDAGLMLIQVADSAGLMFGDAVANGIVYAVDHGASVISMSFGGSSPDPVEAAASAYAIAQGVVVVAAAGNGGSTALVYPAADPGVLSVGATNNAGTAAARFSEIGTWVDVAAPGEAVPVAIPVSADTTDGLADGYSLWDGTSFSAPIVAGEAALLLAAHPTTPPESIAATIESTTAAATLGFGHGLVQFDAAVAAAPVDTVLTAPTTGASVSGAFTVSATSAMPTVRFEIAGTPVFAVGAVTSGVATATLPSYGLSGSYVVTARGCDATTCGKAGAGATVTASNSAPVITSPTTGSTIGPSLVATASADGGSVRFYVDGTLSIGLATAPSYSITVDTTSITDGAHRLTAVLCTTDGTRCDVAHPSAGVDITVQRLRPTVRTGPNPFSPNADRRRDVTNVIIAVEQPQAVVLRIYGPTGSLVRGPISFGTKDVGTFTWVWDGRANSRSIVADGTYRTEVASTRTLTSPIVTTLVGLASATVRVDRTKPAISSVLPGGKSFYPVKDGYLDADLLGATSREALSAVAVVITTSRGVRVRTISAGARPAGRAALAWDGRTARRVLLPAGVYRYRVLAQDLAGNQTLSGTGYVTLSWKKLVAKTATATVAPTTSAEAAAIGACSAVFYDVRAAWPSALGYYSDYYCSGSGVDDDLAAVQHLYTLPRAIKYGTVRVTALGSSPNANANRGAIVYYDRTGSLSSVGATLYPGVATYSAPTVHAASYLIGGRQMWWLAGTTGGNWYDIGSFHVVWTYYVLA